MKTKFALALVLLMVCAAVEIAYGQAGTATVTGTVTDASSAVVPGADVTLKSETTGFERNTISNAEGFFSIAAVPAATYTVTIEMPGFAKWQRTGIVLHPRDTINITNIVMAVAGTAQDVTVSATPETITPVDSGEKAAIITSKQIQNLAVVGRSAVELLKILPGVVYNGEGFPGEVVQFNQGIGNYNVAGLRNEAVAIVSDGADVIDPGCDCGAAVTPNMDMVQEVKVQVSNFSAENAKGPMVFGSVSKSGTAEYHGEAYLYGRHHKLNSQDWRANRFNTPKPRDKFMFPGFNLGGPLRLPWSDFNKNRDKMFFFVGVEFMRQNVDLGVLPAIVPTEKMRKGDFSEIVVDGLGKKFNNAAYDVSGAPTSVQDSSGNAFAGSISSTGVINPAFLDKGGIVLMNQYPLPNRDPAANNGWNYISNIIIPQHRDQELVRIDWAVSDKTTLYTRFNHEYQSSPYPYTLWWTNTNQVPNASEVKGDYHTWSSATSIAHVLSPTTTNEVIFAATDWHMPHKIVDPSKVSRSKLGYPYKGIFKNTFDDMIPNITDWGGGVATIHQAGGLTDPKIFGMKLLLSVEDNFSKVINTHTLKFGGHWQLTTNDEATTREDNGMLSPTTWGGYSTGNAYADLIVGRIGSYSESTKNIVGYIRRRELGFFAQDSWKVSRRLTLEFGARFVHPGWNYDAEGKMAGFDPRKYDPKAPIEAYSGVVARYRGDDVPRSIWKTPPLVVSPRFGFAFDISGRGNTVIRGGAGRYTYHGRGGDSFGAVTNPPLAQQVVLGWAAGTLAEIEKIDPKTQIQPSNLTVLEVGTDRVPSTYNYSLTISQRVGWDTFLEASYVGSTSRHQLTQGNNNINVVPEGAMFGFPKGGDANSYRPFRSYGSIYQIGHSLSQNYNSLQVMLNRQKGRFNFSSAYTYAKALGIGGNTWGGTAQVDNFDKRRRSYGPLPYDRTHSVSVAYNYLVPDAVQTAVLREIFNGWQISGISQIQSGAPLYGFSLGGTMAQAGVNADGEPENSISNVIVAGTSDTPVQPILICDPRKGLAEGQFANPNCFTAPLPRKNGHYQFPYMKTPGFQNHDLSIFKNFRMGPSEDRKLQLRFSGYNIINHPIPFIDNSGTTLQFTNGKVTDQTVKEFGRAAQKRGRRLLQFAIKFMF